MVHGGDREMCGRSRYPNRFMNSKNNQPGFGAMRCFKDLIRRNSPLDQEVRSTPKIRLVRDHRAKIPFTRFPELFRTGQCTHGSIFNDMQERKSGLILFRQRYGDACSSMRCGAKISSEQYGRELSAASFIGWRLWSDRENRARRAAKDLFRLRTQDGFSDARSSSRANDDEIDAVFFDGRNQ